MEMLREGIEPSVPNLTPPCEVIRTLAAFLVKFRPDFTAGPVYVCFVLCDGLPPSWNPGRASPPPGQKQSNFAMKNQLTDD